jgi:hypothetical protein
MSRSRSRYIYVTVTVTVTVYLVRFLWMMATAAATNFRLSQPSPNSEPSWSQDTFTKLHGSLFSRFRVQIAAAIAKAAAARFVPDNTSDGIPTFDVWDHSNQLRPGPGTISPCIISRARSLLFVSVCVSVLRFLRSCDVTVTVTVTVTEYLF